MSRQTRTEHRERQRTEMLARHSQRVEAAKAAGRWDRETPEARYARQSRNAVVAVAVVLGLGLLTGSFTALLAV